MASSKVHKTITYANPGTQPPLYLAGSFSDPQWQPQEMEFTKSDNDNHHFHKSIVIEPGREYQYKFRNGPGDWWILDESAPVVTDDAGNRNNLLSIPVNTKELESQPAPESVSTLEHVDKVEKSKEAPEGQPIPIPTLVVEKTDDEPSHGDDFGAHATSEQRKAHDIRSQDAEADFVIVQHDSTESTTAAEVADSAAIVDRPITPQLSPDEEAGRSGERRMSMTPIPQVSDTAAEVADVAALLDKREATPDVSDNEAGRTGERRLSTTPIPQVAETAAEVADVASKLGDDSNINSVSATPGTVTPANERAPLFAHECIGPYDGDDQDTEDDDDDYDVEKAVPVGAKEVGDVDLNDPTLEEFPHDRSSILSHVRSAETRLNEDETSVVGSPPSPIINAHATHEDYGAINHGHIPSFSHEMQDPPLTQTFSHEMEDHTLAPVFSNESQSPRPSPRHSPAPSLGSIAEEEDEEEMTLDDFVKHTTVNQVDDSKHLGILSNDSNVEIHELANADSKSSSPAETQHEQPSTVTQVGRELDVPASQEMTPQNSTPGSHTPKISENGNHPVASVAPSVAEIDHTVSPPAKDTSPPAAEDHATSTSLAPRDTTATKRRNEERSEIDRSKTPTSIRSKGDSASSGNFLSAFWRTVFVGWIGGLLSRICGGKRNALLALSAIAVLAPALYYSF